MILATYIIACIAAPCLWVLVAWGNDNEHGKGL